MRFLDNIVFQVGSIELGRLRRRLVDFFTYIEFSVVENDGGVELSLTHLADLLALNLVLARLRQFVAIRNFSIDHFNCVTLALAPVSQGARFHALGVLRRADLVVHLLVRLLIRIFAYVAAHGLLRTTVLLILLLLIFLLDRCEDAALGLDRLLGLGVFGFDLILIAISVVTLDRVID